MMTCRWSRQRTRSAALDSVLVANADAETVKFLLDSAKAKLWRHAYVDAKEAREQAAGFKGDVYSGLVRDRFLAEFDEADALAPPAGYAFRPTPDAPVTPPNLMQRRVAVCVRAERRFGNWSGMGAGKTLSAIIGTRVVDARLTVICCPNAVVDNWEREIAGAFPASDVAKKTWHPEWKDPLGTTPRYLVLNYEQFQQPNSEAELVGFLDRNVIDFVVVDEIHFAKQREAGAEMCKRKRLVQGLILEAGKKNGGSVRARDVGNAGHQHPARGQEPGRDDHRPSPRRSGNACHGSELHAALSAPGHARDALEARLQDPARRSTRRRSTASTPWTRSGSWVGGRCLS